MPTSFCADWTALKAQTTKEHEVTTQVDRIWAIAEPYVAAEGIELYDVEVLGKGAGTIVRVTLDDDGSIGVDRIAAISRGLSRVLDEEDPFPGSWTLEVSSPGLERKLRRPEHYVKAIGEQVKVKTVAPVEGDKSHRGAILAANDEELVLGIEGGERRIALRDVASARTVFEWGSSPTPRKKKGSR